MVGQSCGGPEVSQRTIGDLKDALEKLHNRGRAAWLYLRLWRELNNFIGPRPEINKAGPTFWWAIENSLLDSVILYLIDLVMDRKNLNINYVLNLVEQNANDTGWRCSQDEVRSWVEADRKTLVELRDRLKPAIAYRDRVLAHYDKKNLGGGIPQEELGLIPSDIRDAIFECSRILNRYSGKLCDTMVSWSVDHIASFHAVGRLLELGHDARAEILEAMNEAQPGDFSDLIAKLDQNWHAAGRLDSAITHAMEVDQTEHGWKWLWHDRYERAFREGNWP